MTDGRGQNESHDGSSGNSSGRSIATLTVVGLLFIFAAFIVLYRAERTYNRQWIVKKAERIDPGSPGSGMRMVKFSGIPEGEFVADGDTAKQFVLLRRSRYEFRKSAGAPAPDWHYMDGMTERAKKVRVGAVELRLDEAEIIGGGIWTGTVFNDGKIELPAPRIGDRKTIISGIPADFPLFCVGFLANGYLGSGDLLVVSAFSEGKTVDELAETWVWRWLRQPACFVLMMIGFVLLGRPAMLTLQRYKDAPILGSISRIGWPAYLALSLAAAIVIVRFSSVTVDLLWVIVLIVIGVPAAIAVRDIRRRSGA